MRRNYLVLVFLLLCVMFLFGCTKDGQVSYENTQNENSETTEPPLAEKNPEQDALLALGELTCPETQQNFYIQNRCQTLQKIDDNSLLVLFSTRTGFGTVIANPQDMGPDRNFYYVTGENLPNTILVLSKQEGQFSQALFVPDSKNIEQMKMQLSIKDINFTYQFDQTLNELINSNNYQSIYLDMGPSGRNLSQDVQILTQNLGDTIQQKNIFPLLAQARMVKTDQEIEAIQKAIEMTKAGIETMMQEVHEGINESELSTDFDQALLKAGTSKKSFDSIVAAGSDALEIHYMDNNKEVKDGDLLLTDVGAEYNYYAADISRTFPVNGTFTLRQKALYQLVLDTQTKVIESVKPGVTLRELEELTRSLLAEGLMQLGVLKDEADIRKYYPHFVSHHLGLDVHDASVARVTTTPLEPHMVITVEPGIYIPEEGIGIRIEDDILVTDDGHEVLSKDIPKGIEAIQSFMQK